MSFSLGLGLRTVQGDRFLPLMEVVNGSEANSLADGGDSVNSGNSDMADLDVGWRTGSAAGAMPRA